MAYGKNSQMTMLIRHKFLCDSQGQVGVDIDGHILSKSACPARSLNQLTFNQAQLNILEPLIGERIEVEPESSSFDNLHGKFPVKRVHIYSQNFANEQIQGVVLMGGPKNIDRFPGVKVVARAVAKSHIWGCILYAIIKTLKGDGWSFR